MVSQEQAIAKNFTLISSVPGIGYLTAIYILCCTNNFSGSVTGKQLASYAGVVPFEHSSGISVKGKPRVHRMANKELKTMLSMRAMAAVKHYPEFRDYFERKKKEGKNGMSIINAIKNKLVLRVASACSKQTPYVDNHKIAA